MPFMNNLSLSLLKSIVFLFHFMSHEPCTLIIIIIRYMSMGSQVYGYDLRKATSPIIRYIDIDLTTSLQNKDEINQICFERRRGHVSQIQNGSSNMVTRLATADDAGEIRITTVSSNAQQQQEVSDTENKKKKSRMILLSHRDYQNQSIPPLVTCMEYRPRVKEGAELLVSGATDCTIRLWDIHKPSKPISTFHI